MEKTAATTAPIVGVDTYVCTRLYICLVQSNSLHCPPTAYSASYFFGPMCNPFHSASLLPYIRVQLPFARSLSFLSRQTDRPQSLAPPNCNKKNNSPPQKNTTKKTKQKTIAMTSEKPSTVLDEKPPIPTTEFQASSEKPAVVGVAHGFTPRTTLTIQSLGISWFRFPLSVKELTTPVLRDSTPVYQSVRDRRSTGSCTLTATQPTATEVARTTYSFGPGRKRAPAVTIGDEEEFRVYRSGGICCGNCTFQWRGERCEWVYEREMRPATTSSDARPLKTKLLVLYIGDGTNRRKVAELVRNNETRTKGSGSTWAGNGGALVLGDDADEVMVVATVLVMLKREMDRRRFHQIAMLSGAGAGS